MDRSFWPSVAGMLLVVCLIGCGGNSDPPVSDATTASELEVATTESLGAALTFHASFDEGLSADFAIGDGQIYTAPSYEEQDQAVPGLGNPAVTVVEEGGRFGHGLRFRERNEHAIFYPAAENASYSALNWNGTVSFWLSLDPDSELAPGFCDPIQITDAAYNDAAIWVDFTAESPRQFRLGVFGDLSSWNPDNLAPDAYPEFLERLTVVNDPPFDSGRWTHVVITYTGLNQTGGRAVLYLDGERVGSGPDGIDEPFTWDADRAAIRLGVNYVGLFDELSLFSRALSEDEVRVLHRLDEGVTGLYRR